MKITFELDGTGVYYNPLEPIMLDGILSAALVRHHITGEPPARDEVPIDIPLPLKKTSSNGEWFWKASALFPESETIESMYMIRKRFRQNRIEATVGSPNLTNCAYHDLNMKLPLLLTTRLFAYAVGDIRKVKRELRRNIKYIGKKRAYGRGAVVGIDIEEIEGDNSVCMNGRAMRYIPFKGGARFVRPRPPYWNSIGCVDCCEIGDLLDGLDMDERR
jgi:CRISPR type IV-associated protein Csf3